MRPRSNTTKTPYDHLYKTNRWRKIRAQQLARHPWCQCPHHKGLDKSEKAKVADHIKPHKGDLRLFWNTNNLQSLTTRCHNSWKRREERVGYKGGCDEDGMPLDKEHAWS